MDEQALRAIVREEIDDALRRERERQARKSADAHARILEAARRDPLPVIEPGRLR